MADEDTGGEGGVVQRVLDFRAQNEEIKTVTSLDGVLTMPITLQIVRKPDQHKRQRAERAHTNN